MKGISTNRPCTSKAACIKEAGYDFIFRYYAQNTKDPKKVIKPEEAQAIAAAGLQLGVVYQDRLSDTVGYFNNTEGKKDGYYAYYYAQQMHQPATSAIYFGVDCDPLLSQISGPVQDYFRGVLEGFNSFSNNQPVYHIGVYGSGLTCSWLRTHLPFLKYTWLAMPTGWAGRKTFKDWDIKQSVSPGKLCGMAGGLEGPWEINETRTDDFGQFVPWVD